jgi:putative spermidine/putrescine transport system ATP-binding protein
VTLALDRLAVPFGAAPGLGEVSLAVARGERVVLVGASGAGKTSLLRAVAGLGITTGGTVHIGGRDASALPPEQRDAVYLQQTPLLFPHMSVADNIAFPLRVRGVGPAERHGRVAEAIASVRLDGLGSRMPHTLSGGQRHRAALARAVVARPQVLLLDEPLTGLDPSLRAEVRDAVLAVGREYGPAILLVTHDLDEAAVIADRIGVLLDRTLVQVAAPGELLTFPASLAVARFLGGFVELRGRIAGGVFHCALGSFVAGRQVRIEGAATGVVRSDAFSFGATGTPGRVRAVRTLAGRMHVTIALGDETLGLAVPAAAAPAPGDDVRLTVPPDFVSVFSTP